MRTAQTLVQMSTRQTEEEEIRRMKGSHAIPRISIAILPLVHQLPWSPDQILYRKQYLELHLAQHHVLVVALGLMLVVALEIVLVVALVIALVSRSLLSLPSRHALLVITIQIVSADQPIVAVPTVRGQA